MAWQYYAFLRYEVPIRDLRQQQLRCEVKKAYASQPTPRICVSCLLGKEWGVDPETIFYHTDLWFEFNRLSTYSKFCCLYSCHDTMEVDEFLSFFVWKFRRGLYVPTYKLGRFSLEIHDFGKASTATKTLKRDLLSCQAICSAIGRSPSEILHWWSVS